MLAHRNLLKDGQKHSAVERELNKCITKCVRRMRAEICALRGMLKWWPQVGILLRTAASLTKCYQGSQSLSVMLNSTLFVEPVVMDVSQRTSQDQHVAFLKHDACVGLCLA